MSLEEKSLEENSLEEKMVSQEKSKVRESLENIILSKLHSIYNIGKAGGEEYSIQFIEEIEALIETEKAKAAREFVQYFRTAYIKEFDTNSLCPEIIFLDQELNKLLEDNNAKNNKAV